MGTLTLYEITCKYNFMVVVMGSHIITVSKGVSFFLLVFSNYFLKLIFVPM